MKQPQTMFLVPIKLIIKATQLEGDAFYKGLNPLLPLQKKALSNLRVNSALRKGIPELGYKATSSE